MGAMVVTERHLWLNLVDIKEKEKNFLLDMPVLPSELSDMSVEIVYRGKGAVGSIREVHHTPFQISAQNLWGSWPIRV